MFTQKEINYLNSQPLARLATVDENGQPDNSPVGFRLEDGAIYIMGRALTKTRKYKNIDAGNEKVALVIDDLETVDPWKPRGLRVFGTADIVERETSSGLRPFLRIKPNVSWSWNVESPSFVGGKFVTHRTEHE